MPITERTVTICQCIKCGYEWQPRILNLKNVAQCPHCRTIYWDEAKIPKWKEGGYKYERK